MPDKPSHEFFLEKCYILYNKYNKDNQTRKESPSRIIASELNYKIVLSEFKIVLQLRSHSD